MNRGFATTFLPQILHSGIDVQEVFAGKGKAVKSTDSGKGADAGRRRKLTDEQANLLEMSFLQDRKLESERKDRLAFELGLDPRQVAVWFQNRRARWKGKQLEEEYSKLKNAHEDAIFQKCQLETMVLELKQQLFQAEEEKKRLAQRLENFSTRNPTSSFQVDVVDPPLLGELGMGGYETTFSFCESNCLRSSWGVM